MRAVVLCALLCACRLNFEATAHDASGDSTKPIDGSDATSNACIATQVTGFSFGAGVTDLAAAQLPDGYAIGAVLTQSSLFGVHLTPQLVPNSTTPFTTSPLPGGGMYTNASMQFDGTNLDGSLTLADGTAFLKTFQTDMMTFLVAVQKTPGAVGEPSIAVADGTMPLSTWFQGSTVYYNPLAADGSPTTDSMVPQAGTTIVSASAASGPAVVIVSARQGGTCDVAAVGTNQTGSFGALAPICSSPYVHPLGTRDVAVFEKGSSVAAITLTTTPAPNVTFAAGPESTLVTGQRPKLFDGGGDVWLSWLDTRLHVSPLATVIDTPIANLPSGLPDAYEAAGTTLFAVYGPDLWAITCP